MSDDVTRIPVTALPAVHHIVSEAEEKLLALVGTPVRIKLSIQAAELAEMLLQRLVCEQYNVTWSQVRSRSRTPTFVKPRHVYAYLATTLIGRSQNQIVADINRADHTTALHAIRTVQENMKDDAVLAGNIAAIQRKYLSQ